MTKMSRRAFAGGLVCLWALICSSTSNVLMAQQGAVTPEIINSISAPPKIDTRIGTLEFKDGVPTAATAQKAYDYLDFAHAVEVYINTFQGVSLTAFRDGLLSVGVQDNQMMIWPTLLDANTLLLTANADVVYYMGFVDLTKGPMVVETPPGALGTIDDMWFNWVIDFGGPGPDRGKGGRYLLLPPGYDGPVPQGGFYVANSRTTRAWLFGRSFLVKNDPKPAVDLVQKTFKIYPYVAGAEGTSIAEILTGKVKAGREAAPPPPLRFVDGSGMSLNTIPPSDYRFFEMIDRVVQQEPTGSLDLERMGQLASIGIVKGKKFDPDERMKKILTDAAAVGMTVSRTLSFKPRESEGFGYYPGSAWFNQLWVGGYNMETPPPMVTAEGVKPFPPTGARTLNSRTAMFYYATGVTPAMIMRLPGIGSQYMVGTLDADKNDLDGAKTYKVTLPKDIPEENFWSITLYDNQTRSMLQTPQRFPRAGSQSYPSPAAEASADGSTTVYFAPTQPAGVTRGNWIQTMPGKGYNLLLRLYSPTEPFFAKTWRPGEIELVR
jgi:hypothetical protein